MGSSSKNLKQSFLPPGALARGRGQSLKSMGSVRVTAEKRTLIDPTNRMLESLKSKSEKEIGQNFTSMGSVKGSIVVQGTSIGKSRGCSAAYSDRNELASDKNLMQPCLDLIEDETSFPYENLDEMQETARSKPAKENGQNFTSVCSSKESNVVQRMPNGKSKNYSVPASGKNEPVHNKNLMQPGFDPIEVDTLISYHDLEVMGRGKGFTSLNSIGGSVEMIGNNKAKEKGQNFTSLNSVRGSVEKRKMIGNNKGLNSAAYDQNGRGSTFQQRTSIRKSKGYSAVSSDTNVLAHNKDLRQLYFSQIEHDTTFPHDELEVMQHDLRSKSARERAQSFTSMGSIRRCAEKRTLNGQSKDSENAEYELNELAQNNNCVLSGSDPMEDDPTLPRDEVEVMQDNQRRKTGSSEFEKVKKVRGPNLCKVVTGLKPGEKLRVAFYHNRVVGDHHALFSRHLGSLVRDRNMCPLRVHSWTDIEEANLEHMWGAVTEKFDSDDMNGHRDHVLKHMRRLWNNWRGSLHMNAKSKPLKEVPKDVPLGVDKSDWEWLVKEHFLTKKFKETSTRNARNRSKLSMPHRTGSKPIREIIYKLGGKHGNPPDMATIFFETRKKDNKLLEPETNKKYDEIHELLQVEPSLTNIEVVERCFGPQSKSHVVGFGGGITSKDLKGGNAAKTALLEELKASRKEKVALLEELNATRKENESMKRRLDNIEKKCEMFESVIFRDPSSPPSSSE